jgi:predicted KAP-like P-loop ATPase
MNDELQKLPLFKDSGDKHEPERLGQGAIITTLRHAIAQLPPPGCIALYGSWGTGKTSILRQTRALEDANTEERRTVWFDPWEYERHGEVLPSVLRAAIAQLDVSDASRQKWKELATGIVKTTTPVRTIWKRSSLSPWRSRPFPWSACETSYARNSPTTSRCSMSSSELSTVTT